MVISIIGETDKRPIVYTLLKICQFLGDVIFITNDRHYARLIEDKEEGLEVSSGHFQNTFIVVTDKTPDEAHMDVGYNNEDYDYVIYDNKLDSSGDLILYVKGCEMSKWEDFQLGYMDADDYTTISFGFGKKNVIPYTAAMFKNCELVEGKKTLLPIDSKITTVITKIMAPLVEIPEKTLVKAVMQK